MEATYYGLFLNLHKELPDDLSLKLSPTNTIKISTFFESPSSDIAQLIEKVKLYFELYFYKNAPIIRDITQRVTLDFLTQCLSNSDVFTVIKNNLNHIRDNQIGMRKNIYSLYLKHLNLLLKT